MYFLILPNQLFESKYIDKKYKIILWECPHYFTDYKYNKKKLLLHRASMKYYYDYLKEKGYDVVYKTFQETLNPNETYILYNPLNKIELLSIPKWIIYEKPTPNMLLTSQLINEYRDKTDKYFFNAFYMWSKKQLNIIPELKSQDRLNRKKPSQNEVQNIQQPYNYKSKTSKKYIIEAQEYVEKHFKNNYGNIDNFIFPITHKDAKKWLEHFVKNKFRKFGDYQDYIDQNNNHLYHSLLSSLINIGLINPRDIINKINAINQMYEIPLNSYEGFIRQLFWREYQYYCYLFVDFKSSNYFNNTRLLTSEWYTGKTNVLPVDDAIKEAFDTGYLHHIKRLMVVGNFMNLCNIDPNEGFKWFMEFSCDSYEWVMHQNVYDMVFFVTNGKTMRRPYISSSNYILKMSNYKKDEWCDVWDMKYKDFVSKNKNKLYKYRYYVRLQ